MGNSWSMQNDEANFTVFDILGLKNRWEETGASIDVQADFIIRNELVKDFKVIWLVGHHHRADPTGEHKYLLPYPYGAEDPWGDLTRKLWFKKFTKLKWYWRTHVLYVLSVLNTCTPDNLMIVPIYRPCVIEDPLIQGHPCIWNQYLRDFAKKEGEYAGYAGHMNQKGHFAFAPLLAKEVYDRWKITLTQNGPTQLLSGSQNQ